MANDPSELYIIVPLVVCSVIIALIAVIPVLIRRYCSHCIPEGVCTVCCGWTELCIDMANYCVCCTCRCEPTEEAPSNKTRQRY